MSHGTYYCKELGKELPSVTTILDVISKGGALIGWVKKLIREHLQEIVIKDGEVINAQNLDGVIAELMQLDKDVLEDAGQFGSIVHNHLEAIGKGIKVNLEALKPREKRCVEAFIKWCDENVDSFIATEQEVYNIADGYAGTLDSVVKAKNGKLWLLDFKTSNQIYDSYQLQCEAYRVAWEVTHPGIKIDECYILRFEKDPAKKQDMQVKKVENHDYQYKVFLSALEVYRWRNKT